MIAFWLRSGALAILAVAVFVQYRTVNLAAAAFVFFGLILALNTLVVAASFVVSRKHAIQSPPLPAPAPLAVIFIFLHEWLATLVSFAVIQPFDRIWMGEVAPHCRANGRVPLLLIHGYMCNRGIWWWVAAKLRAVGLSVATINLEPPGGSIDAFAVQLHTRIEALCAEMHADQIILVTHSMGGLVARAYLRKHGAARIAKLVTLASPHHGTWLAYYGLGENAHQMRPASAWIQSLEQTELSVPTLSVWSPADNFIAPQDSSRLAAAREIIVPAVGHLTMLLSPRILAILLDELAHRDDPQR